MASGTIKCAGHLASALMEADRCLEAERLLTKFDRVSNLVHGPDHNTTKSIQRRLQFCKLRLVRIKSQDGDQRYHFIRYEEGEEMCVVQGPDTRNVPEGNVFTVATDDLRFSPGNPFICHGSTPLDGKIGEILSWVEKTNATKCALKTNISSHAL